MSSLQGATLLAVTGHGYQSKVDAPTSSIQSTASSSIAALLGLVRSTLEPARTTEDQTTSTDEEDEETQQLMSERKQVLYLRLRNAMDYEEWKAAATELDVLESNNVWKKELECEEYDFDLVKTRVRQLDEARINGDVDRMVHLVRTALARDLGDMGNIKLYRYSHVGTKDLIERYITSALDTLTAILDLSQRNPLERLGPKPILEQVLSARQAFGRSALLLSGGATFGMHHTGVLKALWENKLLPRIISGSSAGSIVCAALCTRTNKEMPELLNNFCHGDLAVFEQDGKGDSIFVKITRFLKYGAVYDIGHLIRLMRDLLGDLTFQEAYNRTRRILNICVSSAGIYELPRLLNYITSPNVVIWSAVAASCSVPLVFSPTTIQAKEPSTGEIKPWNPSPQQWVDGSIDNDLPMTRLAELFNVNHFIVSQVNPHVVPFLVREQDSLTQTAQQSISSFNAGPSWLNTITNLAKDEARHRMQSLAEMGILPNLLTKAVSVLSQKYSGDITIMPEISFSNFPRMLCNPTEDFMTHAMLIGERATWSKLSRIRNHCAIELALDDAVQQLRARVVFSSSQTDLRLGSYIKTPAAPARALEVDTRGRNAQRKLSHNCILDTNLKTDLRDRAHFPFNKHFRHHKASSMHIHRAADDEDSPVLFVRIPPRQAPLLGDILSSGAETSDIFTSDSEADMSASDTETPFSPPTTGLPDLWPMSRQLQVFANSPCPSPLDRPGSSRLPVGGQDSPREQHHNFLTDGPMTAPLSTHGSGSNVKSVARACQALSQQAQQSPQLPQQPSLQQASISSRSGSEARYKKFFGGGRRRSSPLSSPIMGSSSSKPAPAPPVANTGLKRFNALGLEIDLPGTRGMMMKKKRGD